MPAPQKITKIIKNAQNLALQIALTKILDPKNPNESSVFLENDPENCRRRVLVPNGENRRVSRRRQHDFRMGTRNLGQDLSGTAGLARALFPMMRRAEADAQQVSELGL